MLRRLQELGKREREREHTKVTREPGLPTWLLCVCVRTHAYTYLGFTSPVGGRDAGCGELHDSDFLAGDNDGTIFLCYFSLLSFSSHHNGRLYR